jgi:hypothetical protein
MSAGSLSKSRTGHVRNVERLFQRSMLAHALTGPTRDVNLIVIGVALLCRELRQTLMNVYSLRPQSSVVSGYCVRKFDSIYIKYVQYLYL